MGSGNGGMGGNGGPFGSIGRRLGPVVSQRIGGIAAGAARAAADATMRAGAGLQGATVKMADFSAPPPRERGMFAALGRSVSRLTTGANGAASAAAMAAGAAARSVGSTAIPGMATSLAFLREPPQYRPFILPVPRFRGGPGEEDIARSGGVAWRVTADTWVYIVDAQGRLVCDYTPVYALEICAPVLPLRVRSEGIDGPYYVWERRPGNISG